MCSDLATYNALYCALSQELNPLGPFGKTFSSYMSVQFPKEGFGKPVPDGPTKAGYSSKDFHLKVVRPPSANAAARAAQTAAAATAAVRAAKAAQAAA